MAEIARGSVTDRPWGRTLATLGLRGVTGQLALSSEGKRYVVAFERGAVVAASSPLASDAAVRVALTAHLVSSSQVPEISRRQAASTDRDEIEVIAELARLGPDHALRLRRRVIAQRAARTFSPSHGKFVVTDRSELVILPGCELDLRAVIYLGARANLSEQRLSDELDQLGSWFRLKPAIDDDLPQFGFGDLEQPVIERLRDGGTIDDLEAFATSFVDPRTVRAVVYALAVYSACDVEPPVAVPARRAREDAALTPEELGRAPTREVPGTGIAAESTQPIPLASLDPAPITGRTGTLPLPRTRTPSWGTPISGTPASGTPTSGTRRVTPTPGTPVRRPPTPPGGMPVRRPSTPGRSGTRPMPAVTRSPTMPPPASTRPRAELASGSAELRSPDAGGAPGAGTPEAPLAASLAERIEAALAESDAGTVGIPAGPAAGSAAREDGIAAATVRAAPSDPRPRPAPGLAAASGRFAALDAPTQRDASQPPTATAATPPTPATAPRALAGPAPRAPVAPPRQRTTPGFGSPRAPLDERAEQAGARPRPTREHGGFDRPPLRRAGEPAADAKPEPWRVRGASRPPGPGPEVVGSPQAHEVEALIAERLELLDRGADHFKLLGVGEDVAPEALRAAYFALARQLHPDRLAALGISDEGKHAQRLFAQINAGFATLSEPSRRAHYVDVLRRGGEAAVRAEQARADELARRIVKAEEAFRRGELALKRDNPQAAVAELELARQLNPDESDYQALLAWARFCAAPDKAAVATATRAQLDQALRRSPRAVAPRFYLGRVERMLGRDQDAIRHFRDVLAAAPGHADAAAELRVLESRLAGDRPGGGMFGRPKR
ncbi:MAG TPA: DnaJ domain-containing protein [Kofleriaceae bacterium]|nr:DnaJ domain-containing protein [Kofleriaceae bacterium]